MEMAVFSNLFKNRARSKKTMGNTENRNLTHCEMNNPYIIKKIDAQDKEMEKFLFTLGCYEGEKITVISILADNYIINVKDARYSIDKELAQGILI
jgi:ferrous iron transport protein A